MTVTPDQAWRLRDRARNGDVARSDAYDLAETVIAQAEQLKAKDAEIERLKVEIKAISIENEAFATDERGRVKQNLDLKAERETLLSIIDRYDKGQVPNVETGWWQEYEDDGRTVRLVDAWPMTPDVAQFFADRNQEAQT